MPVPARARFGVSLLALAVAAPAIAQTTPPSPGRDITVTAPRTTLAEVPPASVATVDSDRVARTVNATSIEDAVKYLPSLLVRKRNPGDTQAPLATRTSGLGASARSLIYADGALLSALIGNNNGTASPRWGQVSPQEIARVDVLYGPYAAEYPGNAIGAVVTITTRTPDRLEATAHGAVSLQDFRQYGTDANYPTYQLGATIGDRVGLLAFFASYEHVASKAQPLTYVTAPRPVGTSIAGIPASGGFDDVSRTAQPIRVLGASAIPDQRQNRAKLKLAIDIAPATRLTYVGALFLNDTDATVQSYLTAAGASAYAGTVNLDGRAYPVAASAFSGGYYRYEERHWSHALSADGTLGTVDWRVIGTLYDFDRDEQRTPTTALPAAGSGGVGTITRLDGTGWITLDAKAIWHAPGGHRMAGGIHTDRYILRSDRFLTADWRTGTTGAIDLRAAGRTRTVAVWAEDAWMIASPLTLTLGGRHEKWKAYRGANLSRSPAIAAVQPALHAERFSPKAALAWTFAPSWSARASFGIAWRFPTVGELYQVVTAPVAAVPNPNLRPERARSEEVAVERRDAHGTARVALFNEAVRDALLSQTGPLNGTATLATFVQNVDRTRARGVEAAVDRVDVVPRVDLTASVTWTRAETRADVAFPAAVGRTLPQVPRWRATLVGTWRPTDAVSLTAAGRYASRMYGTLDNSDVVGNTYQGFYKYLVVDLRAQIRAAEHLTFGVGVDNVGNDRYFLFHPFPQRTVSADVRWRL